VNALFGRIVSVLRPTKTFFNQMGRLVFVQAGIGVVPVTPQNLNGYLSSYLEIRYQTQLLSGQLRQNRFGLLSRDLIPAFLSSPRVIGQFARLAHFTRVPLFDRDWRLIATPGYHPSSAIYYDGPRVRPRRGTPVLDHVLSGFCWKTAADLANFIGLLLTLVTMLHWIGKHPLAIFSSNVPRLGKTLLATLLGLVADGRSTSISYIPNDEEFERQLATSIEMDDHVVTVDNAKTSHRVPEVSSGTLERCVTAVILNFRRLRTNTAIRRPNDVIFCLTMNTAKMGVDLRQRGLPVNLFFAGHIRDRHFDIANLEGFVLDNRVDLIAELLGMVQRCMRAGGVIPTDAATHSVSQVWAATMDAILRENGYHGFLSNFDASERAFDTDYAVLAEVCGVLHSEPAATATVWAGTLLGHGLLDGRLRDAHGTQRPPQAMATIVGRLFSAYADATFTVDGCRYRLRRTPEQTSQSHVSPTYWFEHIEESEKR